MPEYIERDALLSELQEEIEFETSMYTEEQNKYFNMGLKCAIRDVKSQPAADVTEVVRCKDCAIPHNRFTGCPKLNGLIPPEDHFCSFGERKEDDTE